MHAILYVERDSQKGIVIGKGGARLREVGTAARTQIEKLLGTQVYLDLHVKIAKDWQRDPKQLGGLASRREEYDDAVSRVAWRLLGHQRCRRP